MKTKEEAAEGGDKIKTAPPTVALEDRIVTALAEAGVDGLDPNDLIDLVWLDLPADEKREEEQDGDLADQMHRATAALIGRDILREKEDGTLALSHSGWARRLIAETTVPLTERFTASLSAVIGDPRQVAVLEAEFARLLAGTKVEAEQAPVGEAEAAPTFHAPCSIPGCDHEEAPLPPPHETRAAIDLAALRTLARE